MITSTLFHQRLRYLRSGRKARHIVFLALLVPVMARAACSPWLDKAFLNEYYFGSLGEFLEIYSQQAGFSAATWAGWSIEVYSSQSSKATYSGSTSAQSTCSKGSKTWGVLTGSLNLASGNALVILRDGNGDVVDALAFDNASPPAPWMNSTNNYLPALATQCPTLANRLTSQAASSSKPYYGSNMVVLSNYGNKDIARFPDGDGLWSESGLTGSNTTTTACASNSPMLSKVAASANVAPGGTITWQVDLANKGKNNLVNQTVRDNITASSGAPALSGVAATPAAGCGSVSGFGSTGGAWLTSLATGNTCTLTITAQVPASAATGQTYSNAVSTTIAGYTQSDSSTVTVAASAIDHYEIDVPNVGLTCQSAAVGVRACATGASPCISALATTPTTTTLSTSAGSFTSAGGATQTFTGGANYALSVVSPATVNVALASPTATAKCFSFDGTTRTLLGVCSFDVKEAIFKFDVPNFSAGDGSGNVTITALRSDDASKKCVSFVPTGDVKFWTNYVDPTSGSKQASMSVGPVAYNLPAAKPGSGNIPLSFNANGEATFALDYLDAGLIRLNAEWNSVTGSSSFVVKPYFVLTDIVCADGTTNPAASDSTGGKFCRAGQNFGVVAKAVAKNGSTSTPNFGNESQPEGVKASAALVAPASGAFPTLSGSFGAFATVGTARQASGSQFSWPEVGIISLTPGIADGDYLGAGDANVSPAPFVGRFYPDHFDVVVTPQCGSFVYAGRPGAPVLTGQPFTVRATAMSGLPVPTVATNYSNPLGFSRAVDLSLSAGGAAGQLYVDSVLGGTGAIPASKFAGGVGTVNHDAAAGKVSYVFNAFPTAPSAIAVHADDIDSAVSVGADGTTSVRAGRLLLGSAYGSELLDLPIPLAAEYWASGGYYVASSDDSCTRFDMSSIILSNFTQNLSACETQLSPTGVQTLSGGKLAVKLLKPGAGNFGSVSLALNVGGTATGSTCVSGVSSAATAANLPWFGGTNPAGRATFGIYKSPLIYRRENY